MAGARFYAGGPADASVIDVTGPLQIRTVLYEVSAQNNSGGDLWLQVHDTQSAPAPGNVPIYSYRVVNGQTIAVAPPSAPGDKGRLLFDGLKVAWSSAQAIYAGVAPAGPIYVAGRVAQ